MYDNVMTSLINKWKCNRKHMVEILLQVQFIAPSVSKCNKEALQFSVIFEYGKINGKWKM